jgi:MoaA/NifB/PqqE/SkfB family radical SAM enzyme
MWKQVRDTYQRLKENDAFDILRHPNVLANYRLYQKEQRELPLVMKSHPIGIEIELTNRCNLACIQCLRSLGMKPYAMGDMSFENYQRVLAQFPHVMNLSLNGFGEAMMHRQFFEVVAYSRRERPWCKIGIYSNGMLINAEKAYRLMDCGLTELNISIDAARPDTYRKVRRGGKLDVLHQNIRTLVRAKQETRARFPMLGINFVMLNENEGELVEFVEQAADFGVDFINCITYAGYDWGFQNRRTPESYQRELDAAAKRMQELGVRCKSFPSQDLSWTDPHRPFFCDFFWGNNFRVTFQGEITLGCCTPFKEMHSYGNLLERPFGEIWNNALYQENRALAKQNHSPNAVCTSCLHFSRRFFANKAGSIPLEASGPR